MSDEELLRTYAREGSEAAFTELVRRHAGAVEAAALRQTSNAQLAQDATHAVFLQLARKAGSLSPKVLLLGWLLRAARYAAIDAVRSEARRQRREAEFLAMQTLESNSVGAESESLWARVAPLLDDALLGLRERDRNALLLRFFENKPLAEVGTALGVPEDTARKRVQRALERLHSRLVQRGALASMTVLPSLLSSHAAPASKAALVQETAEAVLTPAAASKGASGVLALSLGRHMFWATVRPWLAVGVVAMTAMSALVLGSINRTRSIQNSGMIDDDYRPAGFPDPGVVRNFVADFQQRLGADRRQDVAGMMRFPLRINSPRGTEYIPDQDQVVDRFDALFSPQVIGAVLKSPNRRLFCNSMGVMVGDGTVWIAPSGDSEHPRPVIIALNLP